MGRVPWVYSTMGTEYEKVKLTMWAFDPYSLGGGHFHCSLGGGHFHSLGSLILK